MGTSDDDSSVVFSDEVEDGVTLTGCDRMRNVDSVVEGDDGSGDEVEIDGDGGDVNVGGLN